MGKRELIIACGFIVVAVVAYQLTAPPRTDGGKGTPLGRIFSEIRREIGANAASAESKNAGKLALRPGTREIRFVTRTAAQLTIVGEKRDDVDYEMTVQSSGPDEATARGFAAKARIVSKDLGVAERLELDLAKESGQQSAKVTIRVPNRLLVGFEGAGGITVSDVRAVDLRNFGGEALISNVTDAVTGTHRSNELTISRAGSVTLTLAASTARLGEVQGAITVNARGGQCAIGKSQGAVGLTLSNVDTTITEPGGNVRVEGEGGTVRVAMPAKELVVDVRRMVVEATLGSAVPADLITTDEPLRVTLAGPPGFTIDASTTGNGVVRAPDFGLEPTRQDRESRLNAPVGGGGARLILRNSNADIVIALRK